VAIKVTATRQAYVTTFHRLTLPEIRRIYVARSGVARWCATSKRNWRSLAAPVT
jgi:hypothetical protein